LVQLKALPDPGSVFAGWSGNDGCASAPQRPTCTVDVSSIPQSVTATFAAVSGPPPTASFTITPNPSPFGQPVSFDASGSWAADGDQITDYRWDFGDSNTGDAGADPVTAHSYQCSGPVQVTLTVTTASGQQGTQRQPLTIAQGRPVCAGIIRLAGDGHVCPGPSACGDGGPAASAELGFPAGVAVDSAGDVYIADTSDQKIRKISASDGTITTIAGDGSTCVTATCGDGGAATRAELFNPSSVALDAAGDIYIADTSDQEIRRVSPDGTITTIAGIHGVPCELAPGCGDGGPATRAQLDQPLGVAVDSAGNVYIADAGDNELRKIAAAAGTITRIAGTGTPCPSAPDCGDGGSPTTAELNDPQGVAVDPGGNVYIADTGDNEIRELTTDGRIARIAGTGHRCLAAPTCGDGGRATDALLNSPAGVAVDPSGGAVYVADTGDDTARYFFPGHEISLFAGNGTPCTTAPACGDGGQATSAQLRFPQGIAVDSFHNVDIADTQNHEIRQAR
jgi:DNA-binding beta-propeller fold protein YncE